jgi:hypothetical protein
VSEALAFSNYCQLSARRKELPPSAFTPNKFGGLSCSLALSLSTSRGNRLRRGVASLRQRFWYFTSCGYNAGKMGTAMTKGLGGGSGAILVGNYC